ncbi:hypothetical protein [Ralstonia pseudosolanacearum]|nr:hypothetical protein [Ralstonia pseudosolanacearum]MDO3530280.1 hypothetical protein [Ralstonia pseudosolanacearum]
MAPEKDEELLAKWKATPLWPLVAEHETSITNKSLFDNFCPEVSFDRFGLFASYLARYAEEIDKELVHQSLTRDGASAKNWAWKWQTVQEMHYTECPLYSQLPLKDSTPTVERQGEVLTLKPSLWGMSVDLKQLYARVRQWWCRHGTKDR